jgi:DNA invertase Pin-like site-specific DNA recombinase
MSNDKGQRVAYMRVSSIDQKTDRQLEGETFDETFIDKASGKDTKRPQLEAALKHVRRGDALVVHSMDRLARNLADLLAIVRDLTDRGVKVEFRKENLTFTGDDTPIAKLLLGVMGSVAEFERAIIRERQREGVAIAKKNGAFKGRTPALTAGQVAELRRRVAARDPKAAIARDLKISRATLYAYLRDSAPSVRPTKPSTTAPDGYRAKRKAAA